MMADKFPCAKCQIPSSNCCSKCRTVYYCSREHQKADWSNHKTICCLPYKIEESAAEGRYLVAKRIIKSGELILQEPPLVIGPKLLTSTLCLGCYKSITGSYRCSRCNWPMCSAVCEDSAFHKNGECRMIDPSLVADLLRQDAIHTQVYQCIVPLRYLCLPLCDRQRLDSLVSHLEQRRNTDIFRLVEHNIANFMRNRLKLTQFDSEEIQRVCGVLDTNCFEIRFRGRVNIRGLFPTASLMNHECVANTRHVFDPDGWRIRIFATKEIEAGERISATYTQSLWNTLDRRWHLKSNKHFWCCCRRCSDPTELGTMLSSLKCPDCGGLLLSQDPLNQSADWKCSECQTVYNFKQVSKIHESIRSELKKTAQLATSCPELLESFVGKYSGTLHPDSCHVMEAKYALVQLYGNTRELLYQDLSDKQIEMKLNYCRQLLKLADIIEPGLSQFRGHLLFELQAVMEHVVKRTCEHGSVQFKELIKEAVGYFNSAADILRHEIHWVDILEQRRLFFDAILKEK